MSATMERSYTTIDKSDWPRGSWDNEPDKEQWIDETTGFDCLAVRHPSGGHWCGYVGVPPGHAVHGLDYDRVAVPSDDESAWPDVHGGLTFASLCQDGDDEARGVCHVPLPGRPDAVWWLGFDCAHSGDMSPGHCRDFGDPHDVYRSLPYVRAECASLAGQLVGATRRPPADWEIEDDAREVPNG
jgi:hypothetical protein